MFTYVLVLAALLDMEHSKPQPVSPHRTRVECQNAAGEKNIEYKDQLAEPENVAKGFKFVCMKLVSDA